MSLTCDVFFKALCGCSKSRKVLENQTLLTYYLQQMTQAAVILVV